MAALRGVRKHFSRCRRMVFRIALFYQKSTTWIDGTVKKTKRRLAGTKKKGKP